MKQTLQQINALQDFQLPKKGVSKMTDRELVARRNELDALIKEAEQIKSKIDEELFPRAYSQPEQKYGVDDSTVMIVSRPNFNAVPLVYAQKHKAVKLVPDSDVLKPMWKEGVQIPGVKITEYVTVRS